uniref:F-box/LRR-repeat protein 15-like leucin rich repeat domain-containing protein n=1 Tax=Salix viminalis TaxID=40686 RepID=A0A6N2LWW2_SALVM
MKTNKKTTSNCNPFDFLTEEIIFTILDYLNDDPFSKKSFSLTCKALYSIESHHRKTLKPLRAELLSRTLHRYPHIEHLDLTLCPRIEDIMLNVVSLACKDALCSINLSRSRFFTNIGLSSLVSSCFNLVEIDLSNGVELNDLAAAAIAEAKNLEKLWLSRCKLITDMGIGCVAVGCRKLRLICLKWCLKVSDLGLQLLALKCKEIRSLDLSYLQITEKCLPSILQLQHLEDLVLEGCLGIDDNALSTLQQSCKSLKTLNMSNCHNHSHVGLSSLINGAENLRELTLAYGPAITEDLAKCLHTFSGLRSVKFDGCLVKCSGVRAIGRWPRSLKELSFSKCSGVEDDSLSFLVRAHKELTKLDITCCRKITYDSVDSITSSCRSLTSVRMESCSLVPKEAFVLFGQRCELIEELDVTDSKIDDEGFSFMMFIAGTETTANTLEWAMALLLNHPKVMLKVKAEIDEHVGHGRLLNDSDTVKLPYLGRVITETLRLYPPAPLLLPHLSSEACTAGGFDIPQGTMPVVNAWTMHRDPKLWEEPDEFKPERFLGGFGELEGFKYIPFGTGRRVCPGAGMGLQIVSLALAALGSIV